MTFGNCLEALLNSENKQRATRLEWNDMGCYITFYNNRLYIHTSEDRNLHPLIVSTGDVSAIDWVLIP